MSRKIIIIFVLLLAGAGVLYAHGHQDSMAGNLIRLHVMSNSNTFYDQDLKYRVKDRIILETAPVFSKAASISEAREIARANMELIRETALDEVRRQGFDYPVQVVLGSYYFPVKEYTYKEDQHIASVTLPAGHYEAIRVIIGSGRGANWWCVLSPPLCFVDPGQAIPPAALAAATALEKKVDPENRGQQKRPEIIYRFRIAELLRITRH